MPFRTDYPLYPDTLVEGLLVDSIPHDIITLSNNASGVKQVATVTVGTAADATVYSIIVDGVTVSVNSGASATATTIRDALIAAIKQSPLVYGKLIPTGGIGTVVLTARNSGTPGGFTPTISGGGTGYAIAATTAAADPTVIAFGRALTTSSTEAANTCRQINAALSGTNVLRGVSCRTNAFETIGIGYTIIEGYPPREAVNVVRRGRVAVRVQEAVTPLSAVWVYHTGAGLQGTFRATTDANASQISAGASWFKGASAGGLAVLELNLP
ncbi:hypothetical protein [Floridanema evergladense]|uniref:Uncharacterized protein n=1 Tax=Floridaenema evergladense BLCC-F167 TaxID=3153639 RepID=A0ABV4WCY5_9CYAN